MKKIIKPITDLRNTNKISELCHENDNPIYITKNGSNDLVIMSNEVFDKYGSVDIKNKSLQCCKNYGYVKVSSATVEIEVADIQHNTTEVINKVQEAVKNKVHLLVLNELCLSGYTCSDLFLSNDLQNEVLTSLFNIQEATKDYDLLFFVGAPLTHNGKLYNCAIAFNKGKILGVVPKSYIPNYNEFYEKRHFVRAPLQKTKIKLGNNEYPFGTNLLFINSKYQKQIVACEICEDLWAANTPSTKHCLAGANIVVNLSASNEIIGKNNYRRSLISATSARLLCGYVYSSAGKGESSTDLIFSAANYIAENGTILKEAKLFENETIISEIDIEKLNNERLRNSTFLTEEDPTYEKIYFETDLNNLLLTRPISPTPFLPSDNKELETRALQIIKMQSLGLVKRLKHINAHKVVIGLSGGLDSTLALIVACEAFKHLNYDSKDIIAITMPCFGTSSRTYENAQNLAKIFNVTLHDIDISQAVKQHFRDIGQDKDKYDVTYENSQARERTQVLFDYANKENAIVIGTGDLSELALGYATYNGDHMSNYGVNASVPKTLIRHIIFHFSNVNKKAKHVLLDVLNVPVSPELLPTKDKEITQKTEEIVGPYILHDFFLYHFLRNNFTFKKIFYLAQVAFAKQYDKSTIKKWLEIFIKRFYNSQFKRSCLPDGVKIGSICLSPRGDFRMPSDASYNSFINFESDD